MSTQALRGQVYRVDLGYGIKPWVVVSNNTRNRTLDSVLAARVTTSVKSGIPTAVPLTPDDPVVGHVMADDIVELLVGELGRGTLAGALCPRTMAAVNRALALALGLP